MPRFPFAALVRCLPLVIAVPLAAASGSTSAQQPPPPVAPAASGAAPGWRAPPSSAAPAATPSGAPAAGSGDPLQLCVDETNRYRATLNLPAVRRSAALERCAAAAAKADHRSGRPHGHFVDTSGCGIAFAENEIPRWPLDYAGGVEPTIRQGLADMWAEGPGGGHYENMRGNYGELGCGLHVEGGAITVVQNFR